jgi:hypothetical protein
VSRAPAGGPGRVRYDRVAADTVAGGAAMGEGMRGHPARALGLAVAAAAGLLVACGDDDGGGGELEQGGLPAVRTPSAEQCRRDARGLRGGRRAEQPVPRPGVYRYSTRGRRESATGGAERFQRETTLAATPARRVGAAACFVVQRRHSARAGETATIVAGGGELASGEVILQGPRERTVLRPEGLLRSLPADELEVAGSFSARISVRTPSVVYDGPAVGRYATEVIGRRRISIGGRSVSAIGLETRLSIAGGDIRATERATRWVSRARALVLVEDVDQTRDTGGDRVRVSYVSRLRSLEPGPR